MKNVVSAGIFYLGANIQCFNIKTGSLVGGNHPMMIMTHRIKSSTSYYIVQTSHFIANTDDQGGIMHGPTIEKEFSVMIFYQSRLDTTT